ncbi:velvet factor-domain-containing protein [Globomyces pollinis-pini]|nr:velvet factor-domain-containing protein [Globomyces pollinis-pini]
MIISNSLQEEYTISTMLEDSNIDSLAGIEKKQLIPTPTTLEIIQNPRQARACGYGKGDYRSIDPVRLPKLLIIATNRQRESRYLHDLTDQPGTYFIFPSLSIRLPGLYKLQYRLIQVFSPDRLSLLPSTETISTIFSDSFRAYPSKTFPGKSKPTILMKFLARQTSDIKSRNL